MAYREEEKDRKVIKLVTIILTKITNIKLIE